MHRIKHARKKLSMSLCVFSFLFIARDVVASEILPVPEQTRERITPQDESLKTESAYKKLYTEEKAKSLQSDDVEKRLEALRLGMKGQFDKTGTVSIPNQQGGGVNLSPQPFSNAPISTPIRRKRSASGGFQRMPGVLSFVVTENAVEKKTVLPLGSTAHGILVTGVESNAIEPYPVLISLDSVFVGPNKKRIDLKDCFIVAKAKANLSVERILGESSEISCVREDGHHIRRPAPGYLSGSDSTFGVQGKLISNQKQVFLTAVLASLAKGAGEAVAMAQKTTTVVQGPAGAVSGTNVTGSTAMLAAGQATTDASAMIAEWYLSFAKQLIPSIAVGASEPVWITLLDTVEIPSLNLNDDEVKDEN